MAHFLVYTTPARGHLYPIVPTLEELRERGHKVSLRTLSGEVERMQRLGFAAAAVDSAVEAIPWSDFKARTVAGASRAMMRHLAEQAKHAVGDCRRAIEEQRPDGLLIDAASFGGAYAAEASGLSWGLYSVTLPNFPSRDTPPFGPGLEPRGGLRGRLRDWYVGRVMTLPIRRMARASLEPLRANLGLTRQRGVGDYVAAAPLAVYYTAEPFEYPRSDWPANVRLVGPGIWDPPADPPGWLAEIEKPLVLVTTSTEFDDGGRLVETALAGLRGEELDVVVTVAAGPSGFEAPTNARIEGFVPHGPVLSRCACVVCHPGIGITQKALAAGVPVCAVPFGRDHLEVARRVEIARAGTRVPGWRLSPEALRDGVRGAMTMRSGARRIAEAFAGAGGPAAAADAFEELLAPAEDS
jgi:UDP:flavonoid glycosyltransferase YjiC (YdhE family)